ncbi:tRNA-modifying protein YgfZ [Thalassotalea sp. G2M2-11]|uniref:tRNA-modifying protein YgfZ n=1 Tax=Thalassotalea sp. G2M2-11 TaxID=2787627 RepID=UPI0019D214E6|nr:tRNA-modifying protein YgfZ [Thalassotalea sp. G2M2-11]
MTITIEQSHPPLSDLPDTYLIALTECNAIKLQGEEQNKYLQGQITCDVNELEQKKILHGAHCNAKGKVFSCFRLFERNGSYLLFQPKSTIEHSFAELKKFGVFAKVEITTADNLAFYALVGDNAETLLKTQFNQVPDSQTPVIEINTTTLIYLAGKTNRYLIIDEQAQVEQHVAAFSLPVYSANVWRLLEIVEGIPYLENTEKSEFVPQMLNMQAIKGISFTKGCYLGQETVARMQYLGKNKKALFALQGQLPSRTKDIDVEKQLGENWRKAGEVIASYVSDDNQCYLQTVLASDTEQTASLRVKAHPDALLTVTALPYSLSQE